MSAALELAERVEEFNRKARKIMSGELGLSASGTASALAILVSLHAKAFERVPAALRARATDNENGEISRG